MKTIKFYMLAEETGAGDEPMAVDWRLDNLKYQKEHEYKGDLKIYEINLAEYIDGMKYLAYDVEAELVNIVAYLLKEDD